MDRARLLYAAYSAMLALHAYAMITYHDTFVFSHNQLFVYRDRKKEKYRKKAVRIRHGK